MTWEDLHRMASVARTDLLLLDGCLAAIAESRDMALHGRLTAEVPTVLTLCTLLDEHGISAPGQLEAQMPSASGLLRFARECSTARARHARTGVGEVFPSDLQYGVPMKLPTLVLTGLYAQ